MRGALLDFRFALRQMARRPGFSFLAVTTLALGIGANAAIFSYADAIAFRPLPAREPARLVAPFATDREGDLLGFSFPDYLDLRRDLRSLEELATFVERPVAVTFGDGPPEPAWAMLVSEGYFPLLGVVPAVGRFFAADEAGRDGRGGAAVAVLSQRYFARRFRADPAVVGSTVAINGYPFTVVGVAAEGFLGTRGLTYAPEIWLPVAQHAAVVADSRGWLDSRASGSFQLLGRLAPGMDRPRAEAELVVAVERLAVAHPEAAQRVGARLFPNRTAINPYAAPPERMRGMVLLALAGVAIVLLVACANVTNLVLARNATRARELAVRRALGAGRLALARQLLLESLVLAAGGAVVGIAIGWAGSRGLGQLLPTLEFGLSVDPRLDGRVVAFACAAALAAALLSGLLPALRAAAVEPAGPLRASRGSDERQGLHLRHTLVGAQIAFSVVVLVAGGLFARSLHAARAMDLGFEPAGAVVFGINAPLLGYDSEQVLALEERLAARLAALAAVRAVTWADDLPLDGNSSSTEVGIPGNPPEERLRPMYQRVAPGYFDVLGMRLLAGRGLGEEDRSRETEAVVINGTLAQRLWGSPEAALGKPLQRGVREERYEVVGVVADAKVNWPGEAPQPMMYFDRRRDPGGRAWFVVRHDGEAAALVPAVRAAVAAVDPRLPLTRVETFVAHMAPAFAPALNGAWLAGAFGLLALLLAAAGVYGMLTFAVAQRTREMAIRLAVGAAPRHVVGELITGAGRLLGVGLVAGLAGAWLVGGLLRGLLHGISPVDPLILVAVTLLLAAVGALACLLPARRLLAIDPLAALRSE
jgi:predicted permease